MLTSRIVLTAGTLLAAAASGGMLLTAADTSRPVPTDSPVIEWQILPAKDNGNKCIERFIVSGADSISRLCFTQLPRPMKMISANDSLIEINAGYYCIESPRFASEKDVICIDVECEWPLRAVAEGPESFHAVTGSGRIIPVVVKGVQSMSDACPDDKAWTDWTLPADSIFRLNDRLAGGKIPGVFDIVPSFKNVALTEGTFRPGSPVRTTLIRHENPEFYRITLTPQEAILEGASDKALAMGRRMLERRLTDSEAGSIPCAVIEDWPDYPYRGLMIDIARNFQTPETMRGIADLMADYRLNRLHFHITDDEGWRLEIPGLPELTEVGSRRGYTTDSHDFLPDIFAGTGLPDNNLPTACGYFTRKEFIDFIRHCDSIGIAVIPEIESPGHARAAIKAMEARYRNTGDDTYRLIEDGDTSRYSSAQFYHDNLMNPSLPGTYRFIGKVADEIAAMYKEAGVALLGIHLGGDEVPEGAWDGSRSATALGDKRDISGRHALQGEYVRNISRLMSERGIPLYGWQDICNGYDEEFHAEVSPTVGGVDCWVSPHDIESNVAVKAVKAGYPVIISNVDYFYMDMLYSPHPEERGLFWGGTVDEFRTLSGYPEKICPVDGNVPGKVIGISGKLFAETIRSRKDMERLLFPKCLGLAERGWNRHPTYSDADFNALLGEKELPRLERMGAEWHLRQPGIELRDRKAYLNSPYRNAEIYFTLDGSHPDPASSMVYTGPVDLPEGEVTVKAILVKDGKSSVPTFVKSSL